MNDLSKREKKAYSAAQNYLDFGDYAAAIAGFTELIEDHPAFANLYYLRSLAYRERREFALAAADVEAGLRHDTENDIAYRKLGELHDLSGDFPAALRAYERYAELKNARRPEQKDQTEALLAAARTRAELAAKPVPYNPVKLGNGVNTPEHLEYFPSLSVDRRRLIFTRRIQNGSEDFYASERQENGEWGPAQPVKGVNTAYDEGAQTISADGNYLVYTSCNQPGRNTGCDLFYSERRGGQWTAGRPLPGAVNTPFYESQPSLSADGNILFFASKRDGGKGGADLYVSGRDDAGNWSAAAPLTALNTTGDDQYPFWSADGRTLYFTSTGYPGMGGEDLYVTRLQPDNTWGPVKNLGYPINTAGNETNLFVDIQGEVAYFSKVERDPAMRRADVNIYQFDLPEAARPTPATYVSALVRDAATGRAIPEAQVILREADEASVATTRTTDNQGTFLTMLPAGRDYALTVDVPGYVFYSRRFPLTTDFSVDNPYVLEIDLQPVSKADEVVADEREEDGSIAFRNVLFASGSAELVPASTQELTSLARVLTEQPTLRVVISGHTDNVGDDASNQSLSENRAAAVRTFLVEAGIDGSRVTTAGYGETRPVASNETPAGRAENRRTTFRLVRD